MTAAPIDQLYKLTDRDRAFPHWGPSAGRFERVASTDPVISTLADWDASPRPPDGTFLFVTHLFASALNGGIGNALRIDVVCRNRLTDALVARLLHTPGTVLKPNLLVASSPFDFAMAVERVYLQVEGDFSTAVANRVDLNWLGFVVPKGQVGFY